MERERDMEREREIWRHGKTWRERERERERDIECKKTITYDRFMYNIQLQTPETEHIHLTVGGNLIHCVGDVPTQTYDISTSTCLWTFSPMGEYE
jgi:hypothetical protein